MKSNENKRNERLFFCMSFDGYPSIYPAACLSSQWLRVFSSDV